MDIETGQVHSKSTVIQCTSTMVIIGLLLIWFAFVSLCFFLDDCLRYDICDYGQSMGNPATNPIAFTLVYVFSIIGAFIVMLMRAKCRKR